MIKNTSKELIVFLIGFVGLYFLVNTFSLFNILQKYFYLIDVPLCINSFNFTINSNSYFNFLIYASLFVIIVIYLTNYLKNLFLEFKNLSTIKQGLAFGIILILSSVIYNNIINLIFPITGNNNQQNVNSMINSNGLLSIITIGILGPIVEEFTYRFGLFGLVKKYHRILAYIVTLLFFSLIHFDFTASNMLNELLNLPSYIIAAFILTYAYDTKNFACASVAHITNNLYSVIMLLLYSWLS